MYFLFRYPWFILLIVTAVPVGWLWFRFLLARVARWGGCLSVALLLPLFAGYSFQHAGLGMFIAYLAVLSGAALYFRMINAGSSTMIKRSALCLAIGLVACFLTVFSGNVEVTPRWTSSVYRVERVVERGFSGGPLERYRLIRYARVPIYEKAIGLAGPYRAGTGWSVAFARGFIYDITTNTLKQFAKDVPGKVQESVLLIELPADSVDTDRVK